MSTELRDGVVGEDTELGTCLQCRLENRLAGSLE